MLRPFFLQRYFSVHQSYQYHDKSFFALQGFILPQKFFNSIPRMSPIKKKDKKPRNLGNRVVFLSSRSTVMLAYLDTISRRVTEPHESCSSFQAAAGLATPQLEDKLEPYWREGYVFMWCLAFLLKWWTLKPTRLCHVAFSKQKTMLAMDPWNQGGRLIKPVAAVHVVISMSR